MSLRSPPKLLKCCLCNSPTTKQSPQYAGTNHRLWWSDVLGDAFHPNCLQFEIARFKLESIDLSPMNQLLGLDNGE